MIEITKEIVIPKEKAVFWMDGQGRWCNAHGPFSHPKIIAYFHRSIRRDQGGYFVEQIIGDLREKVYFHYTDTPLFIVDIVEADPLVLITNREERLKLAPEALFVAQDQLYFRQGEEQIKFGERVLLRMSQWIEDRDGQYFLCHGGRKYVIPAVDS